MLNNSLILGVFTFLLNYIKEYVTLYSRIFLKIVFKYLHIKKAVNILLTAFIKLKYMYVR